MSDFVVQKTLSVCRSLYFEVVQNLFLSLPLPHQILERAKQVRVRRQSLGLDVVVVAVTVLSDGLSTSLFSEFCYTSTDLLDHSIQ